MNTKKRCCYFLLTLATVLFVSSCVEPTIQNDPPYEGPPKGNIISVERAKEMYDTYTQRRIPIIQEYEDSIVSDGIKFEPTRYVEFDLETMKQYIAYIEHEAKLAEVDIKTLLFFLANYPNSRTFENGDVVKYPRKNTLFMVPTMEYEGKNVGFSIEESNGKYTAVPLNKSVAKRNGETEAGSQTDASGQINEAGFFVSNTTAVGETISLIMNEGEITPPPPIDPFGDGN